MSNIFEFNGFKPVVHESAFIHPNATLTGNVIIGKDVYVGPGAAIRGDWGEIVIEDGCNVQENCTIHMFPGVTVPAIRYGYRGGGAGCPGRGLYREGRPCSRSPGGSRAGAAPNGPPKCAIVFGVGAVPGG